jgi:class 3 adenylate cyclase
MQTCRGCGTQNPVGARFCFSCGAQLQEVRKSRKVVSVLFVDVTGSTAMAERADPEYVQRRLSRYFIEMRAVVERHGGTVEKFIGDAVMAVFGFPVVHEDDALRAVRAAGEMRDILRSLELAARIGINTGEVIAGGGETLVTGDVVNVAARLEQAAQPGDLLIGARTYELVRDAVKVAGVEPLALRGKSEPVRAYRLLEVDPGAPARTSRLDVPMVGREAERDLLRRALARVSEHRTCQLFTILGAAGVGKSRLAAEFLGDIGDKATVVRGRCLPYGEGITYWPISEVVRQAARSQPDDTPEVLRERLAAIVDEDGPAVAQLIVEALGLATATGGEEIFWAIRKFFEALSRASPLVVVFDDVHWGEPTFLDLIEYIADWTRGAALLLVCLARPELLESRQGWSGGKLNATTVLLEPLDQKDALRLIDSLDDTLPEATHRRVVDAAEGNPLFIEEMVRILSEGGTSTDLVEAPTIQALLAARLDRLDRTERVVLERAAVEGKVFHRGSVTALSPEGHNVAGGLLSLVRKDLIRSERAAIAGEEAFRFRHLLIRDAAYDAIPKQERADLHKAFATWLEHRSTEYQEILGYHLEQAARYSADLGDPNLELARRAANCLGRAAQAASSRGDVPAAASLFRRATQLDPDASLFLQLAETEIQAGELESAAVTLKRAILEAERAGNQRALTEGELALSWIRMQVAPEGSTQEARRIAEQAIMLYDKLADDAALARAWLRLSEVRQNDRSWEGVFQATEHALEYARRAHDLPLEVKATARLAVWAGPTPADEGILLMRALIPKAAGNRVQTAAILQSVAPLESMRGRTDAARAAYREAQTVYADLGLRLQLATAAFGAFTAEFVAGDFPAAEREARKGYEILSGIGERGYLSTQAAMLGEALYAQGRVDEAQEYANVCREAAGTEDSHSQTQWRTLLAKVLARRGEIVEALRLAGDAVERASAMRTFPLLEGDALMSLAEVLRLVGRRIEAAAAAARAAAAYERKANIVSADHARSLAVQLRRPSA